MHVEIAIRGEIESTGDLNARHRRRRGRRLQRHLHPPPPLATAPPHPVPLNHMMLFIPSFERTLHVGRVQTGPPSYSCACTQKRGAHLRHSGRQSRRFPVLAGDKTFRIIP